MSVSQQSIQHISADVVDFLYKAIDDTQNTIRFTDTKAGVVIVSSGIISGYYLNLVSPMLSHINKSHVWMSCLVSAIGLFSLFAIVVTILSSLNSIRPIENAEQHVDTDGVSSQIPFSINKAPKMGFSDLFIEKKESILNLSAKELLRKASGDIMREEIAKTGLSTLS